MGIIEEAEQNNQLVIPANMNLQQVCFSTWAMGFGTISLLSEEVEQCSGSNGLVVERELFNQNNLLFDGYQWVPLTKDKDYKTFLQLALKKVFPSEMALLKSKGREFNFG
jgi:hypothetical protein